jgi:hypothetical protein
MPPAIPGARKPGTFLFSPPAAISADDVRHVLPSSDADVVRVADRVRRSVARLMERRGLGPQADLDEDTLKHEEPLLAELYSSSVSGRIATGPRAGRRVARVGDTVETDDAALPPGRCCAAVAGCSVHAGVCVPARDCMRLERLARYAGRPPMAGERLSLLPDGKLLYLTRARESLSRTEDSAMPNISAAFWEVISLLLQEARTFRAVRAAATTKGAPAKWLFLFGAIIPLHLSLGRAMCTTGPQIGVGHRTQCENRLEVHCNGDVDCSEGSGV